MGKDIKEMKVSADYVEALSIMCIVEREDANLIFLQPFAMVTPLMKPIERTYARDPPLL